MRGKRQRICMFDDKTGCKMIFDSYASAARYIGSDTSTIRQACNHVRGRKKVGEKQFFLIPEWYQN